jgi:hypothetical protein
MSTQVQFRRGTTTQNNAFTGAQGELSVDTDLKTIRLHDGTTAGGGSTMLNNVSAQTALNKTFSTGSVWQGSAVALAYGGTGSALTAAAGAVPYSTSSGLALNSPGTSGQILVSGGTGAPTWVAASSISAGTATLATTATNIAGGSAGQLIIQSDTNLSTFITAGASGTFLRSEGAGYAPSWATADVTIGSTVIALGSSSTSLAGLNVLTATGTSNWKIPVGTTGQRPETPATGMIRYNSTISSFEGYAASAWASLGGVKSVDGFTFIQAETSAGASNGDLDFYAEDSAGTASTQVGQWNRTNLKDYTGTLVGTQTTQNVFNATATTVNAFGASTATTIGATTGTHAIRNATVSLPNATAITTGQTTVALLNTTATTVNAFGAATALNLGAATGTTTVANRLKLSRANSTADGTGQILLDGTSGNRIDWNDAGTAAPSFTTRSVGTKLTLYPALGASAVDYAIGVNAATLWNSIPGNDNGQFFKWYGGETEVASLSGTGNLILVGDLQVKGGDITTDQTTFNLLNATATTLNIGGAATTLSIGAATGTATINNAQTVFNSVKSIQLPVGTTAQRPTAVTGQIRYNSDLSTFEGYAASAWGSLGGVKSVDSFTYIIPETSAGASNGDLDFYAEDAAGTAAQQVGQWNRTNLKDYTGTIVGTQTTQNVFNATATTVNAFGAATTLNLGAATGTLTVANTTLAAKAITASTTLAVTGTTTLGNLTIGSTKTIDVGANKVTNVAEPTVATDAATKQYVDTIAASSLHYHTPVRVESPTALTATYANGTAGVGATLTNSGTQAALVLDGITLNVDDRVLIYTQANAAHNGVYTVTSVGSGSTNWVLTRALDADNAAGGDPNGLGAGDAFYVKEGTTGAGELYVMNTTGTITVGTTAINFTQISSAQIYSAGTGLTLTGTQYSVNAAQTQITQIGTLTSGTWNASVIAGQYGGTGVANTGKTITLGGNLTTSGAHATTLTTTGTTGITLPTTGTLSTLAGAETLTNKTLTSPILTTPALGVASATSISFSGSTSGTAQVIASAVSGTTVLTLPAASGNLALTGYPNSSTSLPIGDLMTDEAYAGATVPVDAFGIAIIPTYSLMDPVGSVVTLDLNT